MKAIVYYNYGPPEVLKCEEIEKPAVGANEVLIKVRAASLNALDWRMMKGVPFIVGMLFRLRKPTTAQPGRPGRDVAGQVEAVGASVSRFKPGDEVFGACPGAIAEYACASEDKLALKPANVSFEDAAAVPVAALTALQGLRDKGRIQRGHKVLVDGASGGVGTFAVQIAKAFGAEVTAVCSTRKMDTARSIGADHVIDYTQRDFTKDGQRYDLILGANAYHSIFDYRRALSQDGIYVMAGAGHLARMLQGLVMGPLLSRVGSKKMGSIMAKIDKEDLAFLIDLLAAGKVTPVIDRRYPLSDAAEAVRYAAEGHARGKVVITIG